MTCPDFIELQRHGLYDKDSHDNDGSKKLKYDQIVSVVGAAKTAPTLSPQESDGPLQSDENNSAAISALRPAHCPECAQASHQAPSGLF